MFLRLRLPGKGRLLILGHGVRRVVRTPKAARGIWVPIRAEGKALKTLETTGKVKLKVKIVFIPTGGKKTIKVRPVALVEK